MTRKDGIQQFLDEVDPKIFARGLDYYRSGMVERIGCDGNHVTAEVSGSEAEPYWVEISFTEAGEVEDWSCGCPYDWGPVCKHVAAALLALQKEGAEESPKEPPENKRKAAIQELVGQAEKEQLAALVLAHCQEDKRFLSRVLSELEETGEQELVSIKELVKETIRGNTRQGYIDENGCGSICAELDEALDQAHRRMKREQWGRALEITLFVLLTGIKLAGEADAGSLSWTVEAALETVGLAAGGLAESGDDKAEWVKRLLETAREPVFDGWTEWRYELLRRTAILADSQNEGEFYDTLARLSDRRWESFRDGPRYDNQDKLIRYYVIRCAHGAQEARTYLKRNLAVDEFRLILIREYMEEKDYAAAERLCREQTGKAENQLSRWQYLLYEIYRDWGQREKQIQQARRLTLMGDRNCYQTTKDLLTEDGRWTEEYPEFLEALKASWPGRKYMEILARENETALLMEQVRYYRDEVFRYGGMLAPQYGEEVYSLCAGAIRETAKRMHNRKDYKRTCDLLQMLVDFGGTAEARMLIYELRQAHPRRPALWDELEKAERKLQKKARDT